MTAKEFINKGLKAGDKVILNDKLTCFFGGYKTFEGVNRDLEFGTIFPVFYAVGKNGQMVRRSPFKYGGTYIGLSDVQSIRKAKNPTFEVTLYNRYTPTERRTETVTGVNTAEEAEKMMQEKWFGDGWGVLSCKEIKDEQ